MPHKFIDNLSQRFHQRFLLACSFVLVTFIALAATVEYSFNQPQKSRFLDNHFSHLKQQQIEIIDAIQAAGENTLFLSQALTEANLEANNLEKSRNTLQHFMHTYPNLLEATLFDTAGVERVRFDRRQNTIYQSPEETLQDKSDRDYMFMRHNYQSGSAYFSQIDLNVEFGMIETPYNEVIRFITPVINQTGNTIGYIKTKLSSHFFSDRFSNTYNSQPFMHAVVVSKNGFYMMHPDENKRWGWQLNNPSIKRFHDEFPETWLATQSHSSGIFEEGDDTVIFSKFGQYLWNNGSDIDINVRPMPSTDNIYANGALPDAVAMIVIDNNVFHDLLIGHSPAAWFVMALLYTLICGFIYYYLKQLETDLALRHSKLVVQNTQRNLLTNLGHEIRTPLNGMLGVAELLEAESPRQERLIKHMRRSIERFITLFSNLSTANRIQSDQIFLRHEAMRLKEIAEPIRDLFKLATELKTLEFSVDYDHVHGTRFIGDRYYLQLLISTLLDNAVKFTDQGYVRLSLTLSGAAEDRLLNIKIEDTGMGMNTEEIALARHLFVQGQSQMNRHQEGIGSGLWVAEQLINIMGGKFSIDSELDRGTTVTISIPSGVVSASSQQRDSA